MMPDLERCVSYEGKVYCWNKATKKVAVVAIKDLEFKDCPEGVIQAIISNAERMSVNTGDQDYCRSAAEGRR
jgi:hypothetical protein